MIHGKTKDSVFLTTLFRGFTELSSRPLIAKLWAAAAKSRWSKYLIPRFAKTYQINISEASEELSSYSSLNDFFTRRLKQGARKFILADETLLSPVDGTVAEVGNINQVTELIVKGQIYSVQELLNSTKEEAQQYTGGYVYVLYLSPRDYHRIHSPVKSEVTSIRPIDGKVYPVHASSMTLVRKVLSRNVRSVCNLSHPNGFMSLISVGAMNVSSIVYVQPNQKRYEQGEELAFFEFGSTVVLLIPPGNYVHHPQIQEGSAVKVGQVLGTWKN